MLNAIKDSIKNGEMPVPLASFMKSIASQNGFVPQNFFTKFEKDRIKLTDKGYLKEANIKEQQLVEGVFLLVRMLINQILQKPQKIVLGTQLIGAQTKNFKILCSMTLSLLLTCFDSLIPSKASKSYDIDFINEAKELMRKDDFSSVFKSDPSWTSDMKQLVLDLLNELHTFCETHKKEDTN